MLTLEKHLKDYYDIKEYLKDLSDKDRAIVSASLNCNNWQNILKPYYKYFCLFQTLKNDRKVDSDLRKNAKKFNKFYLALLERDLTFKEITKFLKCVQKLQKYDFNLLLNNLESQDLSKYTPTQGRNIEKFGSPNFILEPNQLVSVFNNEVPSLLDTIIEHIESGRVDPESQIKYMQVLSLTFQNRLFDPLPQNLRLKYYGPFEEEIGKKIFDILYGDIEKCPADYGQTSIAILLSSALRPSQLKGTQRSNFIRKCKKLKTFCQLFAEQYAELKSVPLDKQSGQENAKPLKTSRLKEIRLSIKHALTGFFIVIFRSLRIIDRETKTWNEKEKAFQDEINSFPDFISREISKGRSRLAPAPEMTHPSKSEPGREPPRVREPITIELGE
jgi:hypothetical protein